jgi:hypothetical protein
MAAVDMMEMLRRSGGIEAVSKQLGIPPAIASAGADALVPVILEGFGKQAGAAGGGESGLGALIGMLASLGGGALAANVLGPEATDIAKGNEVLGSIFGSKDVSRSVAADAAGTTGIDPAVLKKMLPILAMLVGGYLSARAGGSGPEGSGGLGGLGSILGSVLGGKQGGGLDRDGDGSPLDDIIGMASKFGT